MDVAKIRTALSNVKSEIVNASLAERKVLSDPKADMNAVASASRSLNALGKINSAIEKAESKIDTAIKRAEPRSKKSKKKTAAA